MGLCEGETEGQRAEGVGEGRRAERGGEGRRAEGGGGALHAAAVDGEGGGLPACLFTLLSLPPIQASALCTASLVWPARAVVSSALTCASGHLPASSTQRRHVEHQVGAGQRGGEGRGGGRAYVPAHSGSLHMPMCMCGSGAVAAVQDRGRGGRGEGGPH